MIKIGIIGTGFGSTQAMCFRAFHGVKVMAICSQNLEKTRKIANELNIPQAYNIYQELLADPQIDLVSIATPNHLHKEMFMAALKANKHILLEKPAGLNSHEIKEMLDASEGYEKLIIVDHPMRFNPVVAKIKELIKTELGKISSIQISAFTNYVSDQNKQAEWIDYPEKGGGQILNMGTHLIDLSRFLLDMPKLNSGNLIKKTVRLHYPHDGKSQPAKIEHQIQANLDWDNGTNSTFFNTTTSFGYKNFELRILAEKGIAFYDDLDGLRVSYSNNQPLDKIDISDHLEHIQAGKSFVSKSFKYFACELAMHLNDKSPVIPYCTLEQALENMLYLEKIS